MLPPAGVPYFLLAGIRSPSIMRTKFPAVRFDLEGPTENPSMQAKVLSLLQGSNKSFESMLGSVHFESSKLWQVFIPPFGLPNDLTYETGQS